MADEVKTYSNADVVVTTKNQQDIRFTPLDKNSFSNSNGNLTSNSNNSVSDTLSNNGSITLNNILSRLTEILEQKENSSNTNLSSSKSENELKNKLEDLPSILLDRIFKVNFTEITTNLNDSEHTFGTYVGRIAFILEQFYNNGENILNNKGSSHNRYFSWNDDNDYESSSSNGDGGSKSKSSSRRSRSRTFDYSNGNFESYDYREYSDTPEYLALSRSDRKALRKQRNAIDLSNAQFNVADTDDSDLKATSEKASNFKEKFRQQFKSADNNLDDEDFKKIQESEAKIEDITKHIDNLSQKTKSFTFEKEAGDKGLYNYFIKMPEEYEQLNKDLEWLTSDESKDTFYFAYGDNWHNSLYDLISMIKTQQQYYKSFITESAKSNQFKGVFKNTNLNLDSMFKEEDGSLGGFTVEERHLETKEEKTERLKKEKGARESDINSGGIEINSFSEKALNDLRSVFGFGAKETNDKIINLGWKDKEEDSMATILSKILNTLQGKGEID